MDTLLLSRTSAVQTLFSYRAQLNSAFLQPSLVSQADVIRIFFLFLIQWTRVSKRYNSKEALAECTILIPREWTFVALPVLVN